MQHRDLAGAILDGRYRVDELVGRGAMGDVYRGERVKLGRVVAIKVMNDGAVSADFRKRFEREAIAMAKLEHPHCGSVLDVGVHDDCPYVVMEFVDGKNLKEVLEAGPLSIQRATDITRQVLSGLAHAHEHGVIHRDIKPANVVLTHKSGLGDHVKILDFGLARFHEESSNLTAGLVVGTPNYMAPEQIQGAAIDQRTDLYACGVMLFELLSGKRPFYAPDPVALCMKHLKEPPPRLADVAPERPLTAFEAVVARALEKEPARRFATAHEFAQALLDVTSRPSEPRIGDPTVSLGRPPSEPRPELHPPPAAARGRNRGRIIAAVGAGALALGVVAAVVATRGDDDTPPTPVPAAPAPIVIESPPPPAEVTPDAGAELISRATELASAGQRDRAIDLLVKARKTYPDDARLPYTLAKLYLEKMWWADGLKQARAALALDPKLRTDPELIKLAVRGFNTTKRYDGTLARFLRDDIGDAAKPYIQDTAEHHPNPIVRARAKSELRRYR